MRRTFVAALAAFLLLCALPLNAADVAATVAKITGKAQLQKGTDWVPLSLGQKLKPGDTLSTGFRSEIQLQIGASTVTVKALSRLTLKDLTQSGSELNTDLYLKVGKVDAEVNKSETVTSQKFTVSSPVATASVRGTAFRFDGIKLEVYRGLVDFTDMRGNLLQVPVGESASAPPPESDGSLTSNQQLVSEDSTVQYDSSSDYGYSGGWDDYYYYSYDGYSYWDILSYYDDYNWYGEMPTSITIGGFVQ
jgi:hypothetical protein